MYFLKIGGTELPTPCEYSVSYKDIESSDSGRSDETGVLHRNRIRKGVITCEAKWRISGRESQSLGISLSDKLLDVTLLDPSGGNYKQCEMYADSYKCEFYQQQNASESGSYWEIECRLTEF